MSLPTPLSIVERGEFKFVIMDAPTDDNIDSYIKELEQHAVQKVVRACEQTYSAEPLRKKDIEIVEMFFADGSPPSDDIISSWLQVVQSERSKGNAVAVHCVAGLGRAPVLVAIALMELASVDALDAVESIRRVRRGAINQRQFNYLKTYRVSRSNACCVFL